MSFKPFDFALSFRKRPEPDTQSHDPPAPDAKRLKKGLPAPSVPSPAPKKSVTEPIKRHSITSSSFRPYTPDLVKSEPVEPRDTKPLNRTPQFKKAPISTASPARSISITKASIALQQQVHDDDTKAADDAIDPSPKKNRRRAKPRFGLYKRATEVLSRQTTDTLLWSQALSNQFGSATSPADPSLLEGAVKLQLRSFQGVIDCGKGQLNPAIVQASLIDALDDRGFVLLAPIIVGKGPPKLVLRVPEGRLSLYPGVQELQQACLDHHQIWLFRWEAVQLADIDEKALLSNRYGILEIG